MKIVKKIFISIIIFAIAFNYNYTVNAEENDIYDIVLFFGQSNMVGYSGIHDDEREKDTRTITTENSGIRKEILDNYSKVNHVDVPIEANTVYIYKYTTNTFEPITSSTNELGERLRFKGTSLTDTFEESIPTIQPSFGTNMIPQFCHTYYKNTGHKVLAIMIAKGGEEIATFLPQTDSKYKDDNNLLIYNAAKEEMAKVVALAKTKNYTIGSKLWVMFQGEADVKYMTSNDEENNYVEKVEKLHNYYKSELGLEYGFIVETSHTIYEKASDVPEGISDKVKRINSAQNKIISQNNDISLGSNYPYEMFFKYNRLSVSPNEYNGYIHFTSAALSQIGYDTAINAANFVKGNFVKNIYMNSDTETLEMDENSTELPTLQLNATVSPNYNLTKYFKWKSSDEEIATVDNNGLVTAKKLGNVTITYESPNGSKKATCNLTIQKKTERETEQIEVPDTGLSQNIIRIFLSLFSIALGAYFIYSQIKRTKENKHL